MAWSSICSSLLSNSHILSSLETDDIFRSFGADSSGIDIASIKAELSDRDIPERSKLSVSPDKSPLALSLIDYYN